MTAIEQPLLTAQPELVDETNLKTVEYTRSLGVTLRRKYGNVEIEFEIKQVFTVHSALQQQEEMEKLTVQLINQHEHFATTILPQIPNLQMGRTGQGGNPAAPQLADNQKMGKDDKGNPVTLTRYSAKALLLEISKGQRYYKVQTTSGRWQKFGCNIWDAQLKQYGIAELMGNNPILELTNVTVWCEDREKGGAVREFEGLP